jgi:hypothetical protein
VAVEGAAEAGPAVASINPPARTVAVEAVQMADLIRLRIMRINSWIREAQALAKYSV